MTNVFDIDLNNTLDEHVINGDTLHMSTSENTSGPVNIYHFLKYTITEEQKENIRNLKKIKLHVPSTVTSIAYENGNGVDDNNIEYLFKGILEIVFIDDDNDVDNDNDVKLKDCQHLKHTKITELVIPSVQTIPTCCFKGMTTLTTVNFPNVTEVHENSFENCVNLKTVILHNVHSFNEKSFFHCHKDITFEVPNLKLCEKNVITPPDIDGLLSLHTNDDGETIVDYTKVLFLPDVKELIKNNSFINVGQRSIKILASNVIMIPCIYAPIPVIGNNVTTVCTTVKLVVIQTPYWSYNLPERTLTQADFGRMMKLLVNKYHITNLQDLMSSGFHPEMPDEQLYFTRDDNLLLGVFDQLIHGHDTMLDTSSFEKWSNLFTTLYMGLETTQTTTNGVTTETQTVGDLTDQNRKYILKIRQSFIYFFSQYLTETDVGFYQKQHFTDIIDNIEELYKDIKNDGRASILTTTEKSSVLTTLNIRKERYTNWKVLSQTYTDSRTQLHKDARDILGYDLEDDRQTSNNKDYVVYTIGEAVDGRLYDTMTPVTVVTIPVSEELLGASVPVPSPTHVSPEDNSWNTLITILGSIVIIVCLLALIVIAMRMYSHRKHNLMTTGGMGDTMSSGV